jgi:hypothetical protein
MLHIFQSRRRLVVLKHTGSTPARWGDQHSERNPRFSPWQPRFSRARHRLTLRALSEGASWQLEPQTLREREFATNSIRFAENFSEFYRSGFQLVVVSMGRFLKKSSRKRLTRGAGMV